MINPHKSTDSANTDRIPHSPRSIIVFFCNRRLTICLYYRWTPRTMNTPNEDQSTQVFWLRQHWQDATHSAQCNSLLLQQLTAYYNYVFTTPRALSMNAQNDEHSTQVFWQRQHRTRHIQHSVIPIVFFCNSWLTICLYYNTKDTTINEYTQRRLIHTIFWQCQHWQDPTHSAQYIA